METDNSFLGAYLKVQRAYEHIHLLVDEKTIKNLIDVTWIKAVGRPCATALANFSADPDSKVMELTYFPKAPIEQVFALFIGDAIHNLRAAMDHAATAVVRAAGKNTNFVTFPFHEEREKLVAGQSTGLKQIQAALPGADVEAFFKDTVKSYRDGNYDLWALTKADKIDKHNFLLPIVTVAMSNLPFADVSSANGPTVMMVNKAVTGRADQPFGLIRADFAGRAPPKTQINVAINISFPKGEIFGGREVVPTLTDLAQLVRETLYVFEDFAVNAGIYKTALPR